MSDIRSLIEKLDQINESEEVERAIKRGVDKLPTNPTIADIEAGANSTTKAIRDQLQSRDDDSFFRSIERGATRFGASADYIKSQFLGYTAQKLKLPGLYSMPDGKSFVTSDKDGLRFKVVRYADMNDAAKLYQAGYVTPAKAKELQTDNINNPAFKEPPGPKKTSEPGIPGVVPAPGGKDGAPADANATGVTVTPIPEPENTSQTSPSDYVSKRLTSSEVTTLSQFQANKISKDLMNDLRKLLNVLNDSKLHFKSDIALSLVEANIFYERELSADEIEKIQIIVHNLKLLEPKVSPLEKADIGNYLRRVPANINKKPPAAAPAAAAAPADNNAGQPSSSTKKITWQDLAKLNPEIKNPNLIYPGQKIKLPNGSSAVVNQGDTLGSLAQRWNNGGYDEDPEAAPADAPAAAPAPTTADAPPAAAPATAPATDVRLSPAQAARLASDIKKGLQGSGISTVNQDDLDRIFMNIKSKENFDLINDAFKQTGNTSIIDAVNDKWFYNKKKQFEPMLKRLGVK